MHITEGAIDLLDRSRADQGLPEEAVLRVFGQPDEAGKLQVHLGFSEEPEEGDEVLEQGGTEIYLAQEMVEPLEDVVLDVQDERLVLLTQEG